LVFRISFFFLTVFFLVPRICSASKNTFSADSINMLWEKYDMRIDDEEKTVATQVLHNSDSLFVQTLEKKIVAAQKIGNRPNLLKSYLLLGKYYILANNYQKALECYENALLHHTTNEEKAQILLFIAQLKIETSAYIEALEYLRQAKIDVYNMDYDYLQAEILLEEGYCYTQVSNFSAAQNRFKAAFSIIELNNLNVLKAKLFCYHGLNYLHQNDYLNAMALLFQSIEQYKGDSMYLNHAFALKLIGTIYATQEKTAKAHDFFSSSLAIYKKFNNYKGIADINLEIGLLYLNDSSSYKSHPYLMKALEINQSIGNQSGICITNIALADYYIKNRQFPVAQKTLLSANKADQFLNDNRLFFLTTLHFAKYYLAITKIDSALYFANKTFDYRKSIYDDNLLIAANELLADIHSAKGDYKKAMDAYKTAQKIKDLRNLKLQSYELKTVQAELELKKQLINSLQQERNSQNITLQKNFKKIEKQNIIIYLIIALLAIIAILLMFLFKWLNQRLKINLKLEIRNKQIAQQKEEIEVQQQYLIEINQELEKFSIVARETDNGIKVMNSTGEILWVNEGYVKMHGYSFDEIQQMKNMNLFGEQSNADINKMVNVWFGDKKPITVESLNKTKWGQEIWVQTSLTPILDDSGKIHRMIAIDSDITRIKKAESEIRTKNLDITSSINYAKRIQEAMITPFNILTSQYPESFCFHQPKSIVSGDFYWISKLHNRLIVVCADSTGHGVPGAFMSLIGISFLNKIVNEKGFVTPSIILNRLRMSIINQLNQSNADHVAGDGMDMSIISIDLNNKVLEFAGAMNPIIIMRNGEMIELKPDRMPVGFFDNEDRPFSLTNLNLQPNDQIYMFTDGYYDQFGGKTGSKMKGQQFKSILKECANKPIQTQQHIIEDQFNRWKGDHPQVDDVLVLGISVN
jgi:PAS domain S-box-containing protein